jgi:hypothetical protein
MSEEEAAYGSDEITPDQAFIDDGVHQFDGIELQPYTPARKWAADAMDLHYGHVDEAGMAKWNAERLYPGAVSDVGIVLWLCGAWLKEPDAEDRRIDRARRDPVSASREAAEWSAQHQVDAIRAKNFNKGYMVFLKIMGEVNTAVGELEKKTEPETVTTPT